MAQTTCPHLVTVDQNYHQGPPVEYPSFENRCSASGESDSLLFPHQATFCLSNGHRLCPLFKATRGNPTGRAGTRPNPFEWQPVRPASVSQASVAQTAIPQSAASEPENSPLFDPSGFVTAETPLAVETRGERSRVARQSPPLGLDWGGGCLCCSAALWRIDHGMGRLELCQSPVGNSPTRLGEYFSASGDQRTAAGDRVCRLDSHTVAGCSPRESTSTTPGCTGCRTREQRRISIFRLPSQQRLRQLLRPENVPESNSEAPAIVLQPPDSAFVQVPPTGQVLPDVQ